MRLLLPLLVISTTFGCTRGNPAFGAGDTDGDSGRETGDAASDPSITSSASQSSDSQSGSGSVESGTSGTGTASTDPTASDESATAVDTLEPMRDCCMKHREVGCDDPAIEMCVCAEAEACCTVGWTDKCVDRATTHCEAGCAVSSASDSLTGGGSESTTTTDGTVTDGATTTDGGGSTTMGISPCCEPSGLVGCDADLEVEACVCEIDNGCCNEGWDQGCVDLGTENCNLVCG